jgi:photosystem II stability/assembly factor-like uncharacterized protein
MKKKLFLIIILEFLFISSSSLSQWGWFQTNSGLSDNINDMDQLYYDFWAVGGNGKIIKSTDDGASWIIQSSGTTNDLHSIYFAPYAYLVEAHRGYIGGANGTVIRTTNSGASWNVVNTGSTQNINDVIELVDTMTVIAVGDNGTILKSTNRGETWVPRTGFTTNNLHEVIQNYMVGLCAVGSNGTILTSYDGDYWIPKQSGTSNSLNSITWQESFNAVLIASGDGGTVIKTANGGQNWFPLATGITQNLKKIRLSETYFNQSYFTYYLAAGSNGTFITSTDGGASWESRYIPSSADLNSVYFEDMNTGFACGNGGVMLKTVSNHYYIGRNRMDANQIGTWFSNDGGFNYNPDSILEGLEYPRGTGKISRYASGIFIGAIVGTDTLVSVARYIANENYPGYTDGSGIPHGRNDSNYRVYKLVSGINNYDRLSWPNALLGNSDQGAPVYYDNLTSSWRPLDFGSQTMFSVFTDSYPESHGNSAGGSNPLKADIKHLSFSVDTSGVLGNVIFSQFTIINRSNLTWHDSYITLWTDDDIGNQWNDKLGCDSALRLGYTYNGTGSDTAYGNNPPAAGFLLLRGALVPTGNNLDTVRICQNKDKSFLTGVRDQGMRVFNFSINADPYDPDPYVYYQTYRYMKGLNIEGGNRIHPLGYVTTLVYSGDPVSNTGWNQSNYSDMRSYLSSGPLNMNPGDTQVIVLAQVIARGTSSLNSVSLLKQYCSIVKQYYDSCYSFIPIGIKNQNEVVYDYALFQNYPNPFNPLTRIVFTIPKQTHVKLEIYDAAGRLVEILADMNIDKGKHSFVWDGTNHSSGVYFYKLVTNGYSQSRKMVLIK